MCILTIPSYPPFLQCKRRAAVIKPALVTASVITSLPSDAMMEMTRHVILQAKREREREKTKDKGKGL